MTEVTDEDLALLREHCQERDGRYGRWAFGEGSPYLHDDASALEIIRSCLALGVPVTDVLTGKAWNLVVMRLAAFEDRLAALENGR